MGGVVGWFGVLVIVRELVACVGLWGVGSGWECERGVEDACPSPRERVRLDYKFETKCRKQFDYTPVP